MTIDRADYPDDARERWIAWQDDLLLRWRRFARFKSAPPGEVDDLVQEAALRTMGKHLREPFSSKDDATRYGATVLKNVLVDWKHLNVRRAEVPLDDAAEMVVDLSPTPDEIVADRDLRRLLRSAIDDLPPKYRDVVRVRLSGHTYAEGAALLGIKETTFGVRLHHATNKLRVMLAWFQYVAVPVLSWPVVRKVRAVVGSADTTSARHGVAAGLVAALALAGPVASSSVPEEVRRVPPRTVPAAPPDAMNWEKTTLPIGDVEDFADKALAHSPVVSQQVVLPRACATVHPAVMDLPTCDTVDGPPGAPPTLLPIQWRAIRVPEPADAASWEDPVIHYDPPPVGAAPVGSPSLPVMPA